MVAAAGGSLAVLASLLAACSPGPGEGPTPRPSRTSEAVDTTATTVPGEVGIACATGGVQPTSRCTVDQASTPQGKLLTLRHPDGGFRRLLITGDGRGVIAADGAQPARVTIVAPGEIEVAVGGERYRLPATIAR